MVNTAWHRGLPYKGLLLLHNKAQPHSAASITESIRQLKYGRSILTLLGSGNQTCMKITSVEYTVENS
jgi:hypothetical protein